MTSNLAALILTISLLGIDQALAAPLSKEALYYRCYSQLTGMRPPETDPALPSMRNGTGDPIAVCLSLLDSAKFTQRSGTAIADTVLGTQVLNRMHHVHSTFFEVRDFRGPADPFRGIISSDIMDVTSPALYYTRALFAPNKRADSILKGKEFLTPIRTEMDPLVGPRSGIAKENFGYNRIAENLFTLAPVGDLKGVEESPTKTLKTQNFHFYPPPATPPPETGAALYTKHCASCHKALDISTKLGRTQPSIMSANTNNATHKTIPALAALTVDEVKLIATALATFSTINWGSSEGGGFIGSQVYLLKTVDQDSAFTSNLSRLPRRWSNAVLSDALCRSLPLIRPEDGAPFVSPNSQIAFRTSSSCTQCHATMDRAATTLRAFSYFFPYSDSSIYRTTVHHKITPVSLPAETGWPDADDANFPKRPPTGTLYYRTASSGALVNIPVANIDDLGNRLSEQDDFYICMASRYWSYFTGKKVRMDDAMIMAGYSSIEIARFNKVKTWGLALKARSDQSLRWLIEQMLRSPEYADSAFGP